MILVRDSHFFATTRLLSSPPPRSWSLCTHPRGVPALDSINTIRPCAFRVHRHGAASMSSISSSVLTKVPTAAKLVSENCDGTTRGRRQAGLKVVKARSEGIIQFRSSGEGRFGGAATAAVALSAAVTLGGGVQSASAETIKDLYVAAGNNAFLEKEFIDLKVRSEPTQLNPLASSCVFLDPLPLCAHDSHDDDPAFLPPAQGSQRAHDDE